MFIYILGYQGIKLFKDCFNVFVIYCWNFLPKMLRSYICVKTRQRSTNGNLLEINFILAVHPLSLKLTRVVKGGFASYCVTSNFDYRILLVQAMYVSKFQRYEYVLSELFIPCGN